MFLPQLLGFFPERFTFSFSRGIILQQTWIFVKRNIESFQVLDVLERLAFILWISGCSIWVESELRWGFCLFWGGGLFLTSVHEYSYIHVSLLGYIYSIRDRTRGIKLHWLRRNIIVHIWKRLKLFSYTLLKMILLRYSWKGVKTFSLLSNYVCKLINTKTKIARASLLL